MQGVTNDNQETSKAGSHVAALLNYYYQRFLQETDTIEKESRIIANTLDDLKNEVKKTSVRKFIDKL
ncbi:MAG: hypothetical protein WCX97_00390 [Candidatus Magasanikbacteria bacterium]